MDFVCQENEEIISRLEKLWLETSNSLMTRMDYLSGLKQKLESNRVQKMTRTLTDTIHKARENYERHQEQTSMTSVDILHESSLLQVRCFKIYYIFGFCSMLSCGCNLIIFC